MFVHWARVGSVLKRGSPVGEMIEDLKGELVRLTMKISVLKRDRAL